VEADFRGEEASFTAEGVVHWRGISARGGVILCEGYEGLAGNPYLADLPRRCAKGQVLLVRSPSLAGRAAELGIAQRGVFLVPTAVDGVWRAGATYEWERLDEVPTTEGRARLEAALRREFQVEFEVLEHFAAVRPIVADKLPVIGRLPGQRGLAVLNGLGSKGALHGPWLAELLLAHLEEGGEVPGEVDLRRNL
jgi:glycine/D-amino acid oxidase-like deaminating enzyme